MEKKEQKANEVYKKMTFTPTLETSKVNDKILKAKIL